MALFDVLKRAVPFVLAMVIGLIVALPFAGSSAAGNVEAERFDRIRAENQRLRKENCRLKWKVRKLEDSMMFERRITVPEPPVAPVAPVAPLAPAPPPPPAAPEIR